MTPASYQLSLNFEQVLTLVKQLPYPEKLLLSQELEKEVLNSKLTSILESFKTDELSLETITEEVEAVRSEIYARKSAS
ncbi:MAG: type II toxin-antitoxin system VapB15 family antitoxin [Planktothrix sp.]|uniref:type II toxin-antitoxin system VapB15 family antitoxin n=1 Tax=Planktothrix sp. TaxID=3088171 RepID=UPI0038D48452